MHTFLIVGSIVAGMLLGVLSNWIYDLLKNRGIFPDRPSLKYFVIVVAVFVPLFLLVGLPQVISSKPLSSSRELQVGEAPSVSIESLGLEKRTVKVEEVNHDNCHATEKLQAEIAFEGVVTHILESEVALDLSEEGNLRTAFGTVVKLGQIIAETLGYQYGAADPIWRSVTVQTAPGTRMRHIVAVQEIWETGIARVFLEEQVVEVPFRFRSDIYLELISSESLGCPSSPVAPTPTLVASEILTSDISPGLFLDGFLTKGQSHQYHFNGARNRPLLITIQESGGLSFEIRILDPNGELLFQTPPQLSSMYKFPFTPKTPGEYTVEVAAQGGSGDYRILLNLVGNDEDAYSVTPLETGQTHNRASAKGASHAYSFVGSADETAIVTIQKDTGLVYQLRILLPGGRLLMESPPVSNNIQDTFWVPPSDGTYILRVEAFDGYGDYAISFR